MKIYDLRDGTGQEALTEFEIYLLVFHRFSLGMPFVKIPARNPGNPISLGFPLQIPAFAEQ